MANRPKPTSIKKLNGNPGKRPLNENEPMPDKTPPTCPSWLPYQARMEWKRVVPELERLGLLTMVDRAALAGYCEAYARWVKAARELKDGFTYEYQDENLQTKRVKKPEVEIARDALNQVKAFCIEFGLTPSSRGKMSVPNMAPEQDPLDKMLGTAKN
ncbi:MAG: phage terminase small subunit P27 family [Dehalococcoidales bacterium]|nr:phage terminase small subunit P27 family [Dehalococcoidales bacterium]